MKTTLIGVLFIATFAIQAMENEMAMADLETLLPELKGQIVIAGKSATLKENLECLTLLSQLTRSWHAVTKKPVLLRSFLCEPASANQLEQAKRQLLLLLCTSDKLTSEQKKILNIVLQYSVADERVPEDVGALVEFINTPIEKRAAKKEEIINSFKSKYDAAEANKIREILNNMTDDQQRALGRNTIHIFETRLLSLIKKATDCALGIETSHLGQEDVPSVIEKNDLLSLMLQQAPSMGLCMKLCPLVTSAKQAYLLLASIETNFRWMTGNSLHVTNINTPAQDMELLNGLAENMATTMAETFDALPGMSKDRVPGLDKEQIGMIMGMYGPMIKSCPVISEEEKNILNRLLKSIFDNSPQYTMLLFGRVFALMMG